MASITAGTPTSTLPGTTGLRPNGRTVGTSSAVLGLPVMENKGRVRCSMKEKKGGVEDGSLKKGMGMGMGMGMGGSVMGAAMSSPAMALVDERMSTEGTGLPFGLSNNVLGWILFGVFGLIWALYFVYTSSLEEDEDSGLSL